MGKTTDSNVKMRKFNRILGSMDKITLFTDPVPF